MIRGVSKCIHFKIWVHSSLFNCGDDVFDRRVFGTLPSVLMSLLLNLISPLDIPCKMIYGLETLFYDHRSFQSAFVLSFKIQTHFSLFWAGAYIAGMLDARSSHWESGEVLQGFAASSSLELFITTRSTPKGISWKRFLLPFLDYPCFHNFWEQILIVE